MHTYPYQLYVTLLPFSTLCSCHFYNFAFRASCRRCLQDKPPGQPLEVSTLRRTVIVCIYVSSSNKYLFTSFCHVALSPHPSVSVPHYHSFLYQCVHSPPPLMISHPDIRTSTSLPRAGTTSPQSNQTLRLL